MSTIFTTTGNKHNDLWLVNGSPEFAIFPAGLVDGVESETPIYLKVGNLSYGETHIRSKHFHWVKKQNFQSVAELVYFKLEQPGLVYCTETDSKLKIMMRLNPSAMLVLQLYHHPHLHFSVTTIYQHQSALDGEKLGRYPGRRKRPT
ncbi:MAG: hypothetical protein ABL915_07495 [Gallionella sp.]